MGGTEGFHSQCAGKSSFPQTCSFPVASMYVDFLAYLLKNTFERVLEKEMFSTIRQNNKQRAAMTARSLQAAPVTGDGRAGRT